MPSASRQVSLISPVYGFRLAISRIPGGRAIRGDSCSGWSVAREVSYLGVELTQNACGPVILQFPKTEGERAAVQRGIGSRRSGRGRISALARCDHHEAAQDPARSLTAP